MKTLWGIQTRDDNTKLIRSKRGGREFNSMLAELSKFSGRILVDLRNIAPADMLPAVNKKEALARSSLQSDLSAIPNMTIAVLCGETGGLAADLALCCKYRIAEPLTTLEFSGALDGLLPPGETMWRLAAIAGLSEVFGMVIRGKKISLQRARKTGLIDAVSIGNSILERASCLGPFKRKKPKRIYKTLAGRFLFKKQALSELSSRSASNAAFSTVRLFFDFERKKSADRIRAVADEIDRLSGSSERKQLLRIKKAQEKYLAGEKSLPARALVIMGEDGWKWTSLLAHYGVNVRWCWHDEKELGDGMCWLRRDLERNYPDRVAEIISRVNVSENICGFADRDLIVLKDKNYLEKSSVKLLKKNCMVFLYETYKNNSDKRVGIANQAETDSIANSAETDNIANQAETDSIANQAETDNIANQAETDSIANQAETDKSRNLNLVRVSVPYDPLTSRSAVLKGNGKKEVAGKIMRSLGFIVLPKREGDAVFKAIEGFENRYKKLKEEGEQTDFSLICSLKSLGFATQKIVRRKHVYRKLKGGGFEVAYDLICALWQALRDLDKEELSMDLIDLSIILELGFPIHLGGPHGFLEQIKENPMILKNMNIKGLR